MDIRDAYPSVSMSRLRDIIKSTLEGVKPKVTLKKFIVIGSGGKKTIKETIFDGQSRSSWYTGIHVRPCIAMDMRNVIPSTFYMIVLQCPSPFKCITLFVILIGCRNPGQCNDG